MRESERIKILAVDDLPEQALVYRSILEGPGVDGGEAVGGVGQGRHGELRWGGCRRR